MCLSNKKGWGVGVTTQPLVNISRFQTHKAYERTKTRNKQHPRDRCDRSKSLKNDLFVGKEQFIT